MRLTAAVLFWFAYLTLTRAYRLPGLSLEGAHEAIGLWGCNPPRLPAFWINSYVYVLTMLALLGLFLIVAKQHVLRPLLVFLALNLVYFDFCDWRLDSEALHLFWVMTAVVVLAPNQIRWALGGVIVGTALGQLNPSWLQGGWFEACPPGLPLIPHGAAAVWLGRGVVALQLIAPWLWLYKPTRYPSVVALMVLQLWWLALGYTGPMLTLLLLGAAPSEGRPNILVMIALALTLRIAAPEPHRVLRVEFGNLQIDVQEQVTVTGGPTPPQLLRPYPQTPRDPAFYRALNPDAKVWMGVDGRELELQP